MYATVRPHAKAVPDETCHQEDTGRGEGYVTNSIPLGVLVPETPKKFASRIVRVFKILTERAPRRVSALQT